MSPTHSRHQTIFLGLGLAAVTALGALAPSLSAQAQPQFAPIVTHALNGNVYWIEGGVGSNSGVVVGTSGVVVIDAKQTPESGKAVMAEIAKITSRPVTHMILTHSNLDHVDGLPGFPKGLTIIAQDNCKQQMEHPRNNPQNIDLSGYIPTKTVAKKESMTIDGVRFVLLHWAPAHTSGDLIILSAGPEDRFHRRYHGHSASLPADSPRRRRLFSRLDRKHEGNRGAQRRYLRSRPWRDADQG